MATIDGSDSTMMNRSTQKELIKLLLQLDEMWPQLELCDKEQQTMVLDILNTVNSKCQQDFSKEKASEYADTVQALGHVIKITDWQHTSKEELAQCIGLCQEIILQVIKNLRQEKEIKKDIVFLPYKASMWDSLESVWKAAYEDKEHCNAYVMPIPYADLNPDRSVAAWHCERDQFPKYVPTLDWQDIDLEEWHPDIIFIHNPYDNYNRVTSVESRYYSQNLKKCTNKLVYIPYFVLEEPCTEESIENFVMTAGVLNADKVIVQSEAMRELYVNILIKKTEHTDRAYWEKRISSEGSPKIEKVLTSKKEDFEMPEKWLKLVEGKKVILYNTSISAVLQNSDKVCDKLRYVFDIFCKRDDVVLWWRPHPLMKSTFHSMRTQYEEEYLSIEKQYIEEGWGVYDDSSDLHRAICWSDAYYGDPSSVMNLYRISEKLVLIEDILNLPYKPYWMFDVALDEKKKLWFNPPVTNAICSINLNTGNFNIEHIFLDKKFISNEIWSYALIQKIDNLLLLSPFLSRDIYIYNTDNQKELLVHLDEKLVNNNIKFYGCISQKDRLLFFGRVPLIVEYHIKTQKLAYHVFNEEYGHIFQSAFLGYSPYIEFDENIWIALANSNLLVRFDCQTYTITHYEVGDNNDEYHYITTDGIYFYMSTRYSHLVRWDMRNNETVRYNFNIEKSTEPYNIYFSSIVFTGAKVLLFPAFHNTCSKKVVIFDPKSQTSEYFDIGELGYRGYLLVKKISNGDVIAYEPGVSEFHIYDNCGRLKEKCAVKISSCDLEKWKSELLKRGSWIFEQTMMDIRCFVDNFSKREYCDTSFQSNNIFETVCGNKIYSNIVDEVFL